MLARRGRTEAVVDLAVRAGLPPVGLICEIAGPDGRMLRGADLDAFARVHGLPLVTISELVEAAAT